MTDLFVLRVEAGLSIKECCKMFSITERTYRNWMKKQPPGHVTTSLQLLAGDLSYLSPHWKGFKIYDGDLWTPEGERVTSGDIRAIRYSDRTLFLQSCQIKQLESTIKGAANDPVFDSVDSSSCRLFRFPPRR